jgi:hypothetical protein
VFGQKNAPSSARGRPGAALLVKNCRLGKKGRQNKQYIDVFQNVIDVLGLVRTGKSGKMCRRVVFKQKFTDGMSARRSEYARTTLG